MFSSEHRNQLSAGVRPDDPPSGNAPSGTAARQTHDASGPTFEQLAKMQRKYAALKKQMDDLLSKQTTQQRAQDIEREIELRCREAYERAGIPYTPRSSTTSTPGVSPVQHGLQPTEYRISHKSIGFLRPADAANKPFEAVDGEVYVRCGRATTPSVSLRLV